MRIETKTMRNKSCSVSRVGFTLIKLLGVIALLAAMVLLARCSDLPPGDATNYQTGESVVLVGETPVNLAFTPLQSKPVKVRSTYLDGLSQTVQYELGRDYVLEASGQIRRTLNSRIPDFRTNVLYGKEDFDHTQFSGCGNHDFFVYVDYEYCEKWSPVSPPAELGSAALPETCKKLLGGKKLRIVAFGDSITAGGEASAPELIFWQRWVVALRKKYPSATIEIINAATGGDSTESGLQRLPEKGLEQKADLVLIGFGMNDHNLVSVGGVPLEAFSDNLREMIDRVRAGTGAEIVLYSTFPPNPKWHYGTNNMAAYAFATEAVAREKQTAFADVYRNWQQFASKKKPEDLLNNNINHPNDFGHWIYFQALMHIGL